MIKVKFYKNNFILINKLINNIMFRNLKIFFNCFIFLFNLLIIKKLALIINFNKIIAEENTNEFTMNISEEIKKNIKYLEKGMAKTIEKVLLSIKRFKGKKLNLSFPSAS